MRSGPISRIVRWALITLAIVVLPLQFGSSCDPEAKSAVIEGVNGLADTMVQVFFQVLTLKVTGTST